MDSNRTSNRRTSSLQYNANIDNANKNLFIRNVDTICNVMGITTEKDQLWYDEALSAFPLFNRNNSFMLASAFVIRELMTNGENNGKLSSIIQTIVKLYSRDNANVSKSVQTDVLRYYRELTSS